MGFKNRFVVLGARPARGARIPWWPRTPRGDFAFVTVHECGWTLGKDPAHAVSARGLPRLKDGFLDEYEELGVAWEWRVWPS